MTTNHSTENNSSRLERWRLILGGQQDGTGCKLQGEALRMDRALEALYDSDRSGGLGSSAPKAAAWLGDIRKFFPSSVVKVMQKDAFERLGMERMLLEPEFMENVEPNVHLAATLIGLQSVMPNKVKDTARLVVRKVVEDLERKLAEPMREAVTGSLNKAIRNNRPRHNEMDWNRTIRANLKHYQQEYRSIIPERRIGYGRKKSALRDIVLCIDQSGSMGTSVVYSSIFGAVLASIKAVSTRMVVFDTEIVDLSDQLSDPVEVLFGIQLGGGTDINRAMAYCETLIERPEETIFILISDLYEGGDQKAMIRRAGHLKASGVQVVALLALNDDGQPSFDHRVAEAFAAFDIPSFACTPDQFPDLMAVAIQRRPISEWAASQNIVLAGGAKQGG
ncbi:VWA domain-containing protein [Deinococcus roseus]|uniref:VWA domain-containing protein n=1 Tax=Deinococcus roseus TaxID=392414 RepID=A0ABQ2DES9_9DEIO|nr:VWA domain-containing protein [Deinococcus roseus]GGJ54916.1 VWA domain-containing protein [Deinococcus roseus]